jgi:peptide-methionine (R)-S-oxide reductase
MVRKRFSEDELRSRLDPLQFQVTQEAGTERAFTGVYWDNHESGTYRCVVCEEPLFTSDAKYDSGTGWPSFWRPIRDDAVETHTDLSHGMTRVEVRCATCGAHLGHLFPDGPQPSGERYCMNSASMRLDTQTAPTEADTNPHHGGD